MIRGTNIGFAIAMLFLTSILVAQPVLFKIHVSDTVISSYDQPVKFNSTESAHQYLNQQIRYWQQRNFLEVSWDSITTDSSLLKNAWLHLGKRYDLKQVNIIEKESTKLNVTDLQKKIQKQLIDLENNGYPFARIILLPVTIQNREIAFSWQTDSGQFFTYDTLTITGNSLQDRYFLMQYLNIRVNARYIESNISQIDKRLQQLPFLKLVRPSYVYFYEDKAQVVICIDDKPSGSFEGIIGISNDAININKYKVTGEVNLQLNNLFQAAGAFTLQWRRLAAQNAELLCHGYYPYILGAPIALEDEFTLFRQDSNFQRLKNSIGFNYLFSGLNAFQFYFSIEKSTATLTQQQQTEALTQNRLPSVNDYLNKNYGLKFLYKNLDQPYFPSRGANIIMDINTGTHQVLKNSALSSARNQGGTLYSLYDSLPKQITFQAFANGDFFIPVARRQVFNTFFQTATLYHPQLLFNEQFQLGGLKTFRGVNELSIKATSYALVRMEYRYLLQQAGYLNLFLNGIWYESNIVSGYTKNTLLGGGLGLGLQTKGGVLTVMYALADQNGFNLQQGKVHIGFLAVFK